AASIVALLSYLMVSRIRFRSFKDLRLTRRTIQVAVIVGGVLTVVLMNGFDKAFVFLVLITGYIVLGLAETVLIMKRRFFEQRQERLAQAQAAAAGDATDEPSGGLSPS